MTFDGFKIDCARQTAISADNGMIILCATKIASNEFVTVSNFTLTNMRVGLNGGWSIRLSGYNNTLRNISVSSNGCGGISIEGGDRVRLLPKFVIIIIYAVHLGFSISRK